MSLHHLFAGYTCPTIPVIHSGCDGPSAGRRSCHTSMAILTMKTEPQGTVAQAWKRTRGALEGKHWRMIL
jgi:hypothetical protein